MKIDDMITMVTHDSNDFMGADVVTVEECRALMLEYARSCVPKKIQLGKTGFCSCYNECRDKILSRIEADEQSLKSNNK